MCSCSSNFYSSSLRLNNVTATIDGSSKLFVGEEASAILDMAILITGIHHLIEWVRCTILLTVVCLGVNLMQIWYVSLVNTIFGMVGCIMCLMVINTPAGQACSEF
jgi:hypothetical protein